MFMVVGECFFCILSASFFSSDIGSEVGPILELLLVLRITCSLILDIALYADATVPHSMILVPFPAKEANRESRGLGKISSFGEGHPPKQPAEWEPRKERCQGHNMIRQEGNCKRSFEEKRSGMMNELTFLAIPCSQLTDEPIILERIIEGNQVRRILVDEGSSSEIMYEHCFRNLGVNIRS
nr:reverse transcriptase domain-containing protein [Tanacetum cinerariifolium]